MTVELPVLRCAWCHLWPCACVLPRVEHCACGAILEARPPEVQRVVEQHVRGDQHQRWRQKEGQ